MNPEPTPFNKAVKDFRDTLKIFNKDLHSAINALRQTSWLFFVPCMIMLVTYLFNFLLDLQTFTGTLSTPPERTFGLFDIAWAFISGITAVDGPFTTKFMGQVFMLYHIYIMLLVLLCYPLCKRAFEHHAGEGMWKLFWSPFFALFILAVTATLVGIIYSMIDMDYYIDDFIVLHISFAISGLFTVALASFFEGGIIVGFIGAEAGDRPGLRNFLTGSAVHFRKLLALNIILYLIYTLVLESYPLIYKYYYLEYYFQYHDLVLIPFFAAPFLLVLSGHSAFKALKGSVMLMLRHIGRFLAFFLLAGLVLMPFEILMLRTDSIVIDRPDILLYLKGFALNSILLLASCIIALVFYMNVKRSLDEDAEEIA